MQYTMYEGEWLFMCEITFWIWNIHAITFFVGENKKSINMNIRGWASVFMQLFGKNLYA